MPAHAKRVLLAAVIVLVMVATFAAGRRALRGENFYTLEDTVAVRSPVDGMLYRVHAEHANAARAADVLARTNINLTRLMRALKLKYIKKPAVAYPRRVEAVQTILARYNPDNLAENSPLDPSGDTSYTLDKGALIALCLRERDPALKKCLKGGCAGVNPQTMKLHDEKVTTFVAIHELAHVAINAVDHPPVFWSTFRFLLEEADAAGVLRDADSRFDLHPTVYCGLRVDYVPTQDPGVPTLQ